MVGLSGTSMGSLLQKLGVILAQEYALIRGINGDIQEINDEMSSIQAFLIILSMQSDVRHEMDVMNWVRQIRDVSYDIEDCVDEFKLRLVRRQRRGDGFMSSIIMGFQELATWYPRRNIVLEIKELRSRAQRISERRIRYGVEMKRFANEHSAGRGFQTAVSVVEYGKRVRELVGVKDPVGMTGTMEELGRWLSEAEKQQGVLALVGSSGVGKTTLAMALYRNFQDQFDRRAMVTVSQKYNLQAVLRSILTQIMHNTSHVIAEMNEYQLRDLLHQLFRGKRFFLLIDDVWSPTAWITIRKFLPTDVKGSKILVTTRFEAVARTCFRSDESDVIHRVNRLSEGDSIELFMESLPRSTRGGYSPSSHSIEQAIERCDGLPLAIVLMAGHVATGGKSYGEWSLESIISSCYHGLPTDLQSCMLYLGTFPKSYKISRKRLTRRWLAAGLLDEQHGLSVEEVAEIYFKYLLIRNITRPTDHCTDGTVKTCQVHDMIHEFIVHKCREESFINVVGGHWMVPEAVNKVRRLSLHTTDHVQEEIEGMNLSRVRSVTVFASSQKFPFRYFKFRIVQVLDLEGCRGLKRHHIKQVSEMIILKILSLRKTDIDRLPSTIGRLVYLETLDIRETNVSVLPKSVIGLHRLSNLLGGNKKTGKSLKLPKEMATRPIVNLRILSGIEIVEGSSALTDLHYFTTLSKLLIYRLNLQKDSLGFKDLMSSIEYLGSGHLLSLGIDDESSDFVNSLDSMASPPKHLTALHLHGKLLRVPEWIPNLDDLIKLTLSVTVLSTDTFELLAPMPSLFCLTFSFSAEKRDPDMVDILDKNKLYSGGSISVPGGGYKSLKLLRFTAPLLPLLNFSEGAMPELQRIDLQFTKLEGLSNMGSLASLREVHLAMNKQADAATGEIVSDLTMAARGGANKLRVIVDAC